MYSRAISLAGLLVLGVAVIVTAATPAPPRTISYQGRLTDAGGSPVPDNMYAVDFIIWNDPTATASGNKMWESGALAISTVGGLFNVNLGAVGQPVLPDTIFVLDTNLYLGITINGGTEQTPRTKLTSVAYAYVAGTVPDSSLHSTKIIDEAGLTYSMIPGSYYAVYSATGVYSDIITVNITAPTGGFIVVEATGQVGLSGPAGSSNYLAYQIDQTAGGGNDPNGYTYFAGYDNSPNSGLSYMPFTLSRPYLVFSGGSYTFRLEAFTYQNDVSDYFYSPIITATYYPTYYGLLLKASSASAHIDTAYVDGQVPVRKAAATSISPQLQQQQKK